MKFSSCFHVFYGFLQWKRTLSPRTRRPPGDPSSHKTRRPPVPGGVVGGARFSSVKLHICLKFRGSLIHSWGNANPKMIVFGTKWRVEALFSLRERHFVSRKQLKRRPKILWAPGNILNILRKIISSSGNILNAVRNFFERPKIFSASSGISFCRPEAA